MAFSAAATAAALLWAWPETISPATNADHFHIWPPMPCTSAYSISRYSIVMARKPFARLGRSEAAPAYCRYTIPQQSASRRQTVLTNIAVNSSSTSFIMLRRTARDILPTQQNVAPWIKFRTGLLRTFSNCPVRSARHFVRHGKASREQSCFPALPESRPLSSIASPCPSSGLPPAAMRSSSSLTLRTASTGRAHPCFGQTRAKSRIDQINRVDGSAR
jgi:hypothetical protein